MSRGRSGMRGTRSPASIGGWTTQYQKNRGRTHLTGIATLAELTLLLRLTPKHGWPRRRVR